MNILFLTHNFPPEVNAPASRTFDHARQWVKEGHHVTVITSEPNFPKGKIFPGYRNVPRRRECMEGIEVVRVATYIAENKGFWKRTLSYISFSLTAFLAGLSCQADIIVATSPQFFTALAGRALAGWKRKPWVMEVRDLWPESIKTVGMMSAHNPFIRYFEWQEMRCYRSARRIVVVTDAFKQMLIARGVAQEKIAVVKNGANRELFRPQPKDEALLAELGLNEKHIVGYIGTHGMAHRLDFILDCAAKMQSKMPEVHFLFIGNGAERNRLVAHAKELALRNVTMLESVPKQKVARYIALLDVALINLRRSELFKTVIPSKIFENAGMEIPILMGVEGEAQQIVESFGAGLCFRPEDADDFERCLGRLLSDKKLYAHCQEGCRKLSAAFDRKVLAKKMLDVLTEACSGKALSETAASLIQKKE